MSIPNVLRTRIRMRAKTWREVLYDPLAPEPQAGLTAASFRRESSASKCSLDHEDTGARSVAVRDAGQEIPAVAMDHFLSSDYCKWAQDRVQILRIMVCWVDFAVRGTVS